ncbi:Phototropic-responsive NPH3 family protein [Rhynchospora pubera]|uniref:Phototropic-responsive NPH3 family protein n=1 Tax=Rhynchospora pubera TaxID=906938 RepID=A0AAV8C879_9POAL|nr:Phototropic-responsive NPH3 family protein [Rhynchospora pubera]
MKFMKLGSKPDSFQTDGNDVRIVGTELATDITIHVGEVKFHLHKFPLLSKSGRIQKLLASPTDSATDIHLNDVPGGATSFEICAKFCYGTVVTLNPHNVISTRCAAEYLEMHESVEKSNLVYKIDVFLSSSVFRSWKDSIIALQTMKTLKSWCEDLKLVARCMECIASKASVDVSKVEWSYTYNRKKLVPSVVPKDWWVEDLTEIELDHFKQIIDAIKTKARVSYQVIGEAVKTYTYKRVPGLSKISVIQGDAKVKTLVDTVTWLLPSEKGSVSCSFLLKLLRAACMLRCAEACKKELGKRIGRQLEEASVNDLLIPTIDGEVTIYDIDMVLNIVEEFLMQNNGGIKEMERPGMNFCNTKGTVAKLVDGYLAEVAKDRNTPLSKFLYLAEMIPNESRPIHDGLYRAVDMYLKEHPNISKGEKKKLCSLLDCRRLSPDACAHAVQNERLPLRLVVQVLFHEQSRTSASASVSAGSTRADNSSVVTSYGSSRSAATTTTTEDDSWDGSAPSVEDGEKRHTTNGDGGDLISGVNGIKVKGNMTPKTILGKILPVKGNGTGVLVSSGSDSSGSPGSGSASQVGMAKATPARNVR